jgi:hypothetical protein
MVEVASGDVGGQVLAAGLIDEVRMGKLLSPLTGRIKVER